MGTGHTGSGKMMRVAAVQMPVGEDVADNRRHILAAIDRAAEAGAELLLTPEGALSGYVFAPDDAAVGESLSLVTEHARHRGVGLALGACMVESDGRRYNQLRFYRPDGEFLGFHAKQLLCVEPDDSSKGEKHYFCGGSLGTFAWRDGIVIGGLICNDMWGTPGYTSMPDPHLAEQLGGMGVRVIFHAVNGGRDGSEWAKVIWNYHESNLQLRARAAGVWIVTVDNCRPENIPCAAPSGVIDPAGAWRCRTKPVGQDFIVWDIPLA